MEGLIAVIAIALIWIGGKAFDKFAEMKEREFRLKERELSLNPKYEKVRWLEGVEEEIRFSVSEDVPRAEEELGQAKEKLAEAQNSGNQSEIEDAERSVKWCESDVKMELDRLKDLKAEREQLKKDIYPE